MIRFWTATITHYIGSVLSEGTIKDIPAYSSDEAYKKALLQYQTKISPGATDTPRILIEEDRSVITGIISRKS